MVYDLYLIGLKFLFYLLENFILKLFIHKFENGNILSII